MKNLKIILQSKKFYLFLLFVSFVYSFWVVKGKIIFSSYHEGEIKIIGTIVSLKNQEDRTTVEIKGKEKVIMTIYEPFDYEVGDQIEVEGTLKLPSTNRTFGLFNYRNYLLSKKIYYQLVPTDIRLVNKNHSLLYDWKGKINDYFDTKEHADYLKYLLLGDSSDIKEDVLDSYQHNGISHLFSVSGMHITFLATTILAILNRFWKDKKRNYAIVSIILLFYSFVTGFSPSILRALLLFYLLTLRKIVHLKIDTIYLLMFVISCLLFYNPYYVYHLGFLYSFTISFVLIYGNRYLKEQKGYFRKLWLISLLAFLTGIPISLTYNFELTFLTPIYNLFFVPYVTYLLFPLSFFVLLFAPLGKIYHVLISILETLSQRLSSYSLFTISFMKPSFVFLGILIASLIWIIIGIYHYRKRRMLLLPVLLAILYMMPYFRNYVVVTVLDVGQGDAILMELPYNRGNILIDTGGNLMNLEDYDYNISKNTLIPYLKSRGIQKLDFLLFTHGDFDHMGEAFYLVNHFPIEKVIFNPDGYNELEQELIKILDEKRIEYCQNIKELNLKGHKIYFLNHKLYDNENDNSNVLYFDYNGVKMLFMGDAGIEVEEDILKKYDLTDIDILKVGHHGSKTSSSEEFISSIHPKYSIISVGKNNWYGHPHDKVLENLSNSMIYRTDLNGSMMFKIKHKKLEMKTCIP